MMKESKKKNMQMRRLISDDEEDFEIDEITFQNFTNCTFPWESPAKCKFYLQMFYCSLSNNNWYFLFQHRSKKIFC